MKLVEPTRHKVFKWSGTWYGCCGICVDCMNASTEEGGQAAAMLRLERHVLQEHAAKR